MKNDIFSCSIHPTIHPNKQSSWYTHVNLKSSPTDLAREGGSKKKKKKNLKFKKKKIYYFLKKCKLIR